jgi:hypothetical protein
MPNQHDELFTPEQVIEALGAAGGVILGAAAKLNCDRHTVERYRDTYPVVAEAIRVIKENRKDMAELKLLEAVDRGEGWAVRCYLENMAGERGWGRKPQAPALPPPLAGRIDPAGLSDADLDLLERLVERLSAVGAADAGGDPGGAPEAPGRGNPRKVH